MKKFLLLASMLVANASANTPIVRLYLNSRDLTQIAQVLQSQPHFASQAQTDGVTPLHELASHTPFSQAFGPGEAAKLAQVLLTFGANPCATDCYGNTPLHIAARAANVAIATLLHQAGASSHVQNKDGRTPEGIVALQLARATPTRVGIDDQYRAIALDLLRITTPSPKA